MDVCGVCFSVGMCLFSVAWTGAKHPVLLLLKTSWCYGIIRALVSLQLFNELVIKIIENSAAQYTIGWILKELNTESPHDPAIHSPISRVSP